MRVARWTTMGTISKREESIGESVLEISSTHLKVACRHHTARHSGHPAGLLWPETRPPSSDSSAGWREDIGGHGTSSEGWMIEKPCGRLSMGKQGLDHTRRDRAEVLEERNVLEQSGYGLKELSKDKIRRAVLCQNRNRCPNF